ncbi:hypothetical protein Droror1_Dr00023116 [Drosera rotundifolia]
MKTTPAEKKVKARPVLETYERSQLLSPSIPQARPLTASVLASTSILTAFSSADGEVEWFLNSGGNGCPGFWWQMIRWLAGGFWVGCVVG